MRVSSVLAPHEEAAAPDGPRNDGPVLLATGTPERRQVSEYQNDEAAASALDRPITITKFRDRHAKTATEHLVPLRGLAPFLARKRASEKRKLPWLKLARFGGERSASGSLRTNANLLAIDGVEGDHDSGTVTVDQAAERLRAAGLAGVIYTSPSHTSEHPRWRVLCPTEAPLPPGERERLCARLNGVLDGALASESFALSQSYYYGGIEGQPKPIVELIDGEFLDLADTLDTGALDKHGKPYSRAAPAAAEPDDEDGDFFACPDLEKIRKALDAIPVAARDDREATWRPVGMALHNEFNGGEAGFIMWDDWSRESGRYDASDQRRVWDSFGKSGGKPTTIATLYRLAKEQGWDPKTGEMRPAGRLRFMSPDDCATAPARGYLVKGLIAPRDVACIFGAPGGGKSTIAPFIGYHVAQGERVFGMRTKPGRVFYVAAEDAHGMANRVQALRKRLGDATEFRLVDGVTDLLDDDSPDRAALHEAISDQRPVLIFVDTLAMAFRDLEENDAKDMNRVVSVARSFTAHGAAVVLIHHGTKAEGSTPRGHSVLNGALDVALQLQPPDANGVIRGRLTKNRNGPCDLDIAFRVASEELGTDEDGDAITAAVVDELEAGSAPRAERLPHAQREALAILDELEGSGRVSDDQWRDACIDSRRVSQSEDRNNRKRAFNMVRAKLYQRGLIVMAEDGVSVSRPELEWPEDTGDAA